MVNKNILVVIISIAALLVVAWSPWITNSYSEKIVSEKFAAEWRGVTDGCGFNCGGCGIKESQRTLFGVNVKIEYACGMLPSDSPEYHKTNNVFVSSLSTVHGVRKS